MKSGGEAEEATALGGGERLEFFVGDPGGVWGENGSGRETEGGGGVENAAIPGGAGPLAELAAYFGVSI